MNNKIIPYPLAGSTLEQRGYDEDRYFYSASDIYDPDYEEEDEEEEDEADRALHDDAPDDADDESD